MRVGIAGTGRMGTAIARRLLDLKHSVVVWNRSPQPALALREAGAQVAATPRELAACVGVVISMLTDEAALDAVYFGADGLLAAPLSKLLCIDMSTVRPAWPQAAGARVQDAGGRFVECPVGGSIGPAREGRLLGFAGGAAEDVQQARELLSLLCRRVEHVGPLGAGSTVKLAINLPLMVYWQTLSEALSLLQPLGLDPARVIDLLSETSGGPNMLKVRGATIAQALAGQPAPQVSVDVATMRKDLRAMLDQAASQRRRLPLTALALQTFEQAAAAGLDGADCTQLPVWWLGDAGRS
ncbi:MAG: NAD(P)-dependent oxidoreductase [Burkholderiaceae bacterium]